MTEPRRRVLQSWHDHGGGVTLYITRHDEGAGPVYRLEDLVGHQWSWGNEAKAKGVASKLLEEIGHRCSDKCKSWEPISK
jgi:hypothetical protein